jgi:hypothetical protein
LTRIAAEPVALNREQIARILRDLALSHGTGLPDGLIGILLEDISSATPGDLPILWEEYARWETAAASDTPWPEMFDTPLACPDPVEATREEALSRRDDALRALLGEPALIPASCIPGGGVTA